MDITLFGRTFRLMHHVMPVVPARGACPPCIGACNQGRSCPGRVATPALPNAAPPARRG